MMTASPRTLAVDAHLAYEWSRTAAEAAIGVPATGGEAVAWTVRGWAEVALGCVAVARDETFRGLDEVVRRSDVPCIGPFADRLRALRSVGGDVPEHYFGEDTDLNSYTALPHRVQAACTAIAEFCDGVGTTPGGGDARNNADGRIPIWATTADHLRWGERFRPAARLRGYSVLDVGVPEDLVRRSWMRLPSAEAPHIVLLQPAGRVAATVRQRVRQGLHNGAHVDHLTALADRDGVPPWHPSPIEFGAGLVAAESYAMSVELLATAECALAGRGAELRELRRGLISRIGRIPGFKPWIAGQCVASVALRLAATDPVEEFAALPTLAAQYLVGPLRLIASGWHDPLIPAALADRTRRRWAAACARFEPAAALAAEAESAQW